MARPQRFQQRRPQRDRRFLGCHDFQRRVIPSGVTQRLPATFATAQGTRIELGADDADAPIAALDQVAAGGGIGSESEA